MLIFSETTAVIITVIVLIGVGWRVTHLIIRWLRRRRGHEHRDDE